MSLKEWNTVNWQLVEKRVFRYQRRIYEASKRGDKHKVKGLQKKILFSLDAKLMAVRVATNNYEKSKNVETNSILYVTTAEKVKLVAKLRIDSKAHSIKKLNLDKYVFKTFTLEDGAKETLCLLALEPEWEAKFENDFYGPRPGRSKQDALNFIQQCFNNKKNQQKLNQFVLKTEVERHLDKLNHEILLNKLDTNPVIQSQIKTWLKTGLLEVQYHETKNCRLGVHNTAFSSKRLIHSFLLNVALHGVIQNLKNWAVAQQAIDTSKILREPTLTTIRYAGDIVVVHQNVQLIQKAKNIIEKWLKKNCGLASKEITSKVSSLNSGFNFLGWQFITIVNRNVTRFKFSPTKKAQVILLSEIREIIQKNKASSSYQLINLLKPKIFNWGNYYRYFECRKIFRRISHYIFQKIRAWIFRIDKRNGRQIVKERYFPSNRKYKFQGKFYQDNWILHGRNKEKTGVLKENWLPNMAWLKQQKWKQVLRNKSIYDGYHLYWSQHISDYTTFTLQVKKLAE